MRGFATAFFAFTIVTVSETARANAPALAGYTGMRGGATCKQCHGGGSISPTLSGPTSLTAGQTASYTITVPAGGLAANFAVSADINGSFPNSMNSSTYIVLAPPGSSSVAQNFDEVTTKNLHGPSGTQVYTFNVVAPNQNGTIKLWGLGMAASGGGTGGDSVGTTTMSITVSGASTTPTDAGTKPTDGGTSAKDGGTVPGGDGGSTPGKDGGAGSDAANGGDPTPPGDELGGNEDGGCSTTGGDDGNAFAWIAAVGAVLSVSVRRRKR